SGSPVTRAPWPTSAAIIRSESTVFLSHPSVTSAMRGPVVGPSASNSWRTWATSAGTPGRTGSAVIGKTGRSLVLVMLFSAGDDQRALGRREGEPRAFRVRREIDVREGDRAHGAVLLLQPQPAKGRRPLIDPDDRGSVGGILLRQKAEPVRRTPFDDVLAFVGDLVLRLRPVQELPVEIMSAGSLRHGRPYHLLRVHARVVDPHVPAVHDDAVALRLREPHRELVRLSLTDTPFAGPLVAEQGHDEVLGEVRTERV